MKKNTKRIIAAVIAVSLAATMGVAAFAAGEGPQNRNSQRIAKLEQRQERLNEFSARIENRIGILCDGGEPLGEAAQNRVDKLNMLRGRVNASAASIGAQIGVIAALNGRLCDLPEDVLEALGQKREEIKALTDQLKALREELMALRADYRDAVKNGTEEEIEALRLQASALQERRQEIVSQITEILNEAKALIGE